MSEHVVGDVVRASREARGWSQQDLAERAGLHKLQVHRIETGERKKLSTAEIGTLSKTLELRVDELLGIKRVEPVVSIAAARLLTKDLPVDHSKATSRAAELLSLSGRWADITRTEQVRHWWTLPRSGREKDKGYALARTLREALGLGDDPIDDVQLLCERDFGLSVALEPLPGNVRGLLVRVGDAVCEQGTGEHVGSPVQGFALVNTSGQTPAAQRYTMAHELAHYLFGDSDDGLLRLETTEPPTGNRKWMELRCNCFAAEFLSPERAVRQIDAERTDSGIAADVRLAVRVSQVFGISWEAARTRVCDVLRGTVDPLLADWTRARAVALTGEWQGPEEGSETGEVLPPPVYLNAALSAYVRGRVDVYDLARIFRTEDALALQRELAEAGWVPATLPSKPAFQESAAF